MYAINVPEHVIQEGNEQKYIAAVEAHIRANAAKGKRREWLANTPDAQRLMDWLNSTGEFEGWWEEKRDGHYVRVTDEELEARGGYVGLANDPRRAEHPATVGMFAGDFGQILLSMRDAIDEYGALTPKQTELVRKALARKEQWVAEAEARRAAQAEADKGSDWVGAVKDRRMWTLVVRRVMAFDGNFGPFFVNVMEDTDGNVIIGKGTKRFGERGDTIKVKATIKAHETRDGIKQTIINRPAFQ